jgi:hypothetical protein
MYCCVENLHFMISTLHFTLYCLNSDVVLISYFSHFGLKEPVVHVDF